MRQNTILYCIVLLLLAASVIFFTNAYRQTVTYGQLAQDGGKTLDDLQVLSQQINKAAVMNPDLVKAGPQSDALRLFFTDSQQVTRQLMLLVSEVKDPFTAAIMKKLSALLKAELPWIIQSNVPDSIIHHNSGIHITILQTVNSLVNQGIDRTNVLLATNKEKLRHAISVQQYWMIAFIFLASLLIFLVSFNLYRQRFRTKIKELELESVLNRISDGVFSLDNKWRYTFANKTSVTANRRERNELVGQVLWEVHPEMRGTEFWDKLHEAKITGQAVSIESFDAASSNWYSIKAYPSPDGLTVFYSDITAFKKADAKLKKAAVKERLYASIVNSSEDAIISKTLTGIVTSWNKGAETIFGFTEAEMTGQPIGMIIPEELAGEETEILERIKLGEYVRHYETERLKKDGSRIKISLTVSPVFDEKGNISGASKIARDITGLKKSELAVYEANEEKETILESIDDAFFAVDKNWNVTYWNSQAAIQLATKKESIIGRNLWDIFSGSINSESYKKYHQATADNQAVHFEDYFEPLERWYEISAYPSTKGLSVYFRDITARKASENKLLELNENLQLQAKALSTTNLELEQYAQQLSETLKEVADYKFALDEASIVAITDQKGVIKYVNENFCRISKYTAAELTGQDHRIINSGYHPKAFIKDLWTTIANGKIWKGELKNKAKDGTIYWVATTIVPFLDHEGKPYQYVAIRADITERKKSESDLTELNQNLLYQTKELERSNTELEQFAYVASHDLQEPLRMVTSFLTQLEKKYAGAIDEKGKTYIGFAVDGAKRMRQIILDLLEFSRVGRTEEKKEVVDTSMLVKDVKVLFRKQIEEKHATIETSDLPSVRAYKLPLYQVFQNLISNALKYAASERPCLIRIAAIELEAYWQFDISDTGIGISPEYFEKIFVIFQRLHNKDDYTGTGMGLAITKKIVDNLGGRIWVTSEENKGSSFHFTIPKQTQ